ncbi:hypothetical protein BLL52_0173 [Rhodoferax antarcticus ANT.BR]|uniref:Uncharacterized protein n=1 Tax=Rhodoferax antarcticus ANT.BR TaxID=1111071 RepID=A0A1Q8YKJ0_9BURK|nr:hypothetical protein BLL52_0173 [Rhodoferax antarcticus ANT.BR]
MDSPSSKRINVLARSRSRQFEPRSIICCSWNRSCGSKVNVTFFAN